MSWFISNLFEKSMGKVMNGICAIAWGADLIIVMVKGAVISLLKDKNEMQSRDRNPQPLWREYSRISDVREMTRMKT